MGRKRSGSGTVTKWVLLETETQTITLEPTGSEIVKTIERQLPNHQELKTRYTITIKQEIEQQEAGVKP